MVYFRKRHILCRILVFIILISFLTESLVWASPFKAELSTQHSSIDKLAPDTEVNNEKFLNTILTIEEICKLFQSIGTVPFNDFWREYYTQELSKIFTKRDKHYAENLMIKFHAYSGTGSVYIYSAKPRSGPGIVWHIYPENPPAEDPIFSNSGLSPFYSTNLNGLNIELFTGTASIKNALEKLTIQPYSSATAELEKIFNTAKLAEHIIDASKTNETLALLLLELLKTRAVKNYNSTIEALDNIINNEKTSNLVKAKAEETLKWLMKTKLDAVKELSKEIKSQLDEVRDSLNNLYHQIEGGDADIPSLLDRIRKECSDITSKLKMFREWLKYTEGISYEDTLISQTQLALVNTLSYGGRDKEYDILNVLAGIIGWINIAITSGDLNNLKDILPRNLKRLEYISKLLSGITTYREEIFEGYTFFVFEKSGRKPDNESLGTGGPAETHREMAEVFRALAELAIRIREVNEETNPASVYMRKYREILDSIIEKYPTVKELYLSPSRTITTDNAGVCLIPVVLNGKDYDVLIYNRNIKAKSEFLEKYADKTCRVMDRGNVQIKILYTPWDADQFIKEAIDIIGKKTGIWFPMKIHRTAGLQPFYDWISVYGYKIERPEDFFEQITSDKNKMNTFINEVSEFIFGERSEQVTELFKENVDWVEIKSILEKLIAVNKNAKKLHVFDAGCSHGLEPYSLLILIQDILGEDFGNWDICITALDKQLGMLNNPLLSRDVPEGTVRPRGKDYSRYFIKSDRGYKVKPELYQKIRFCYSNLEDFDNYGDSSYDFIMSANTLRYIKEQNKLKVTMHLASHLRPGGYFYIQNFYMIPDGMIDFGDRQVELWIRDVIAAAKGYKATPGRNGRSVVLEKPSQDITHTRRPLPQGSAAECLKDLYANRNELKNISITLNNTINPPERIVRWRRTHEDRRAPFNKKTLRTELNSLVDLGFLTKGSLPNLEHVYTITDKLLNAEQWQINKICSMAELRYPSKLPQTPETLDTLKKQIDDILHHIKFWVRFYKSLKIFFVRLFYKLILRREYLTPQELEAHIIDLISYRPSEGTLPKYTEDDLVNIIRVPEEKIKESMGRISPKLTCLIYSKILIKIDDMDSLIRDNLVLPVYSYKKTKRQKWTIAGYEGADILDKLTENGKVIKIYTLQKNDMGAHEVVYRYTQPDERLNAIRRRLQNGMTMYIEDILYRLLLAFSKEIEEGAKYMKNKGIETLTYQGLLPLLELFQTKVIPEKAPVPLQKETAAKRMNLEDILSFISEEENRELIKKAYDIAYKYYRDRIIPDTPRRITYIEHAMEIANELILLGSFSGTEKCLGIIDWDKNKDYKRSLAELISSALVHNVPQTERKSLDNRINEIADKLSKLQNIPYKLQPGYYIQNYYRVVFKKLKVEDEYYPFLSLLLFADRFVSLPFIGQDEEKDNLQNEIFDVYQPMLEELFGGDKVPPDFMDRAFKISDPENYEITKRAIEDVLGCSYEDAQESLNYIADLIKLEIDPDGDGCIEIEGKKVEYKLETRLKGIFSTYLKLLIRPEFRDDKELRDLIGIRIIIKDEDKDKCYRVSDILQTIPGFTYLERSSDDYIKQKKKSGYQSLHEAFQTEEKIGNLKGGTLMEIQIRTKEMHDKATIGSARHGRYKTQAVRKRSKFDKVGEKPLTKDPVENCKIIWNELALNKFKVLRWTVKGEIDTAERLQHVPIGATIADILCRRGINLGDKKIKARVNNDSRNKPEDYVPVNGDLLTISIIDDLEKPHWRTRATAVLPRTKLFSYILDPYKLPMREVSIGAAKLVLAILNDLGVNKKNIEGYIKGLVRGLTGKSTKLQLIDNIIILVQRDIRKAKKGERIEKISKIIDDIITEANIHIKKTPYYRDYFINNLAQFADEKEFRYEGAKERDENIIMELLAAIGVNVIDTEEVINYLKEKYKIAQAMAKTFAPIKKSSKYYNAILGRKGVKDVANIKKVLDSGEGFTLDVDIENVGKLKFCVDIRFLDFYGEAKIIQLIQESIKIRGHDKYKGLDLSQPFYLALLDKSPSIAEDHIANHFIGINKIIFEEFPEQAQRDTLFMISISHELRHEAGFSDENELAKEDAELFRTILDKTHIFQKNIDEFIDNLISHIDENAEFLIELKKLYPRIYSLGGNSLLIPEDIKKDPYEVQKTRVNKTLSYITEFIKKGYPLIFTHGNGPEVYIKLKELGIDPDSLNNDWKNIPEGKLAEASRLTQEWIGRDIKEGLTKLGIPEDRIEIITTHVLVDPKDTEFKKPTKPIGIRPVGEDTRMRVPSPAPIHIIEIDRIAKAILENKIVICVGGGGIPVVETNEVSLKYVNAVIDKDMATALLVRELNEKGINIPQATILTAVDGAKLNYGKQNERHLDVISPEIAWRYYKEGHFEQGKMGPKITAGILMANLGTEVTITRPERIGKRQTTILPYDKWQVHRQTGFDKKMGFFRDEPYVLACLKEAFELYLQLFGLISRRKETVEDTTKEAEEISRRIKQLSIDLKIPTYPLYITENHNLREEAREKLEYASSLVMEKNEPAAEASLLAGIDRLSRELTSLLSARITKIKDLKTVVTFDTQNDEYRIIQGQLRNIVVGDKETVFRVITQKRFKYLWEAFRAIDHEIDGELEEMVFLSKIIKLLSKIKAGIKIEEVQDLMGEVRQFLNDLENVLVIEKDIAGFGLLIILRQLELSDLYRVKDTAFIVSRLLEARHTALLHMIKRTHAGRLYALREEVKRRNEELKSRVSSIVSDLDTGNIGGAINRLVNKDYGLLKNERINAYLREPEFRGIKRLLGFVSVLVKTGRIEKAKEILEIIIKKVENARHLAMFVSTFRDRFVSPKLKKPEEDILKEDIFMELFKSYLVKANLERGSPSERLSLAKLWWTRYYQAVFIPLNIPNPRKKTERIPNPVFKAVSEFITTLDKSIENGEFLNLNKYESLVNNLVGKYKIESGSEDEKQLKIACLTDITQWLPEEAPAPAGMQSCPVNKKILNSQGIYINNPYYSVDIRVNKEILTNTELKNAVREAEDAVTQYITTGKSTSLIYMNNYRVIEFESDGTSKYFVIREKLLEKMGYTEQEFLALLSMALSREKELESALSAKRSHLNLPPFNFKNLPRVMLIEYMSSSPYLFANCTGDGFFGVNGSLCWIDNKEVRNVIFQSGLIHEFWHEANKEGVSEEFLLEHDTLFLLNSIEAEGIAITSDLLNLLTKIIDPDSPLLWNVKEKPVQLSLFGEAELPRKYHPRVIFDKLTSRKPYTVIPYLRWQKDITAKDIVNFQKYIKELNLGDEFCSILITKFLYNIIISTLDIKDSLALKPLEDLFLLDELESVPFFNHSREFIGNYDYNKDTAEKIMSLLEEIQQQCPGISIDNIKKRCQRLLVIKSVRSIKTILKKRNIFISAKKERQLEKLLSSPIENKSPISIQVLLQKLALKIPPKDIFEFLSEITEILDKYLDKKAREDRLEVTKSILAGIIEIIPNKESWMSVLHFEDILFELGRSRGLSQITLQRLMTEFRKGLDIASYHNEVELLGLDINFLILLALLGDIMKLKKGDIMRVIAEIIFTGEAEKLKWGDLEKIRRNLKIDIPDGQTVRYIVKSYLEGVHIEEIERILKAKQIKEQFENIFSKVKQLIETQGDVKPDKDMAPHSPSSIKRLAQIIDFNLGLRRALKSGDILRNNGEILVPEDFYYNPLTLISNSIFKNIVIPQGNTTIDTGEYLTELGEIISEENRIVEELKAKDGIKEQRHKLPIIDGNALIQRISQGKPLEMTTEGKIRFPFRHREASIIEALNIIADYAKIGHLGLMMSDEMVKVRKPGGEEIEINLKDIIKNLLQQELNMDKKLEIHIFSRNIEKMLKNIEKNKESYGLNKDSHLSRDILVLLDEDMSKDLLTDELKQKMLNNELKVLVKGRYTGLEIAVIMALHFLEIDKIYNGDMLSQEAEDILSKFKLTKDEIAKINQEIKDKGFFILPPFITIKQILDEFRMRKVSVEVSA